MAVGDTIVAAKPLADPLEILCFCTLWAKASASVPVSNR
jgi:hypothetical protein